jgi:hypothetical protein
MVLEFKEEHQTMTIVLGGKMDLFHLKKLS